MNDLSLDGFKQKVASITTFKQFGKVTSIKGIIINCEGLSSNLSIGSRVSIDKRSGGTLDCEVVGFNSGTALLMPYNDIQGVSIGDKVEKKEDTNSIFPHESWMGRIVNAFSEPIDEAGPLLQGNKNYPLKASPPNPQKRNVLGPKIDLGVRAIDTFTSCCYGQRLGIFAGSGVGKSVLISMLTRYAKTDIKVIGLIGERGREVKEFIQDYLGPEGLKHAVIVVATGDEPALMRKQAAYMTMAIAEFFRDQGKEVLCIMDSITRFAMAQREIGLATGEPPTTKGYTPTVFSELPKLLERAGPGIGKGNITGLFTVLVEGDDDNEPISDTVRGILDGHIIMNRAIAERGRFPAVDVLRSVSRSMPKCNSEQENRLVVYAKKLLSTYNDMAEMIRLGAYRKGTDPEVDLAIQYYPQIESFLNQSPTESTSMETSYKLLAQILNLQAYYEGSTYSDQNSEE